MPLLECTRDTDNLQVDVEQGWLVTAGRFIPTMLKLFSSQSGLYLSMPGSAVWILFIFVQGIFRGKS